MSPFQLISSNLPSLDDLFSSYPPRNLLLRSTGSTSTTWRSKARCMNGLRCLWLHGLRVGKGLL